MEVCHLGRDLACAGTMQKLDFALRSLPDRNLGQQVDVGSELTPRLEGKEARSISAGSGVRMAPFADTSNSVIDGRSA